MAGEVNIDINAVQTGASEIANKQQTMNGLIDEATSCIQGLSSWEGNAANAFRMSFTQLQTKLENANAVINQYVNFLNTAAQTYAEQETAQATDNSSFTGGQ